MIGLVVGVTIIWCCILGLLVYAIVYEKGLLAFVGVVMAVANLILTSSTIQLHDKPDPCHLESHEQVHT